MARKPKNEDSAEDTEAQWPVVDSYTDKNGFLVKVCRAAYAVAGSNKYSVRPRGISL